MQTFTLIFLIALAITTLTQIWLSIRHIRHIRAHQNKVPEEFASQISLADHQKAADYTCAKTRTGYPSMALHVVLLLCFTLGGGLSSLNEFWSNQLDDTLLQGMALIVSTASSVARKRDSAKSRLNFSSAHDPLAKSPTNATG